MTVIIQGRKYKVIQNYKNIKSVTVDHKFITLTAYDMERIYLSTKIYEVIKCED